MTPQLGTYVIRLKLSTTNRDIQPNDIGRVGGIDPTAHVQPTSFDFLDYFPVQWLRNGLWSSMDPFDEGVMWKQYDMVRRKVIEPVDDEE